jgi:hypothetical protein
MEIIQQLQATSPDSAHTFMKLPRARLTEFDRHEASMVSWYWKAALNPMPVSFLDAANGS